MVETDYFNKPKTIFLSNQTEEVRALIKCLCVRKIHTVNQYMFYSICI